MFISFEGGDGTGKSTQVRLLAESLRAAGKEVVLTREPGGTELGKAIRQSLLHGGEVVPRAEALLYAADRAQHVETIIKPALERGAVVITDRYFDSSIAYQGGARALPAAEIKALSLWASANLVPDLTILLDLPIEKSRLRLGENLDRLEAAGSTFHAAVRQKFLELAANEPERFRVIDAAQSIAEIAQAVREAAIEAGAL